MKRIICAILALALLSLTCAYAAESDLPMDTDSGEVSASIYEDAEAVTADGLTVTAPSAILIEKETGQILFEKNSDEQKQPASVTKVMTILLIVEAVENKTISLEDTVSCSAYAASMGGSQIFLEEGETMTVEDMLKSIVVASANDAAVAMAEHIAGSEGAFVSLMNKRAAELGMENTTFMNCTGLLDQPEHLTTARDIALMSRELIKHDWIKKYTTIWMDSIRNGEFGLSNTNKLVRFYDGATGLKTGFTSQAKYCLSATAEKDGVEFIAVVMGCETSPDRFESAKILLSYGFSNYALISPQPDKVMMPIKVIMGDCKTVQPQLASNEKLLISKAQAAQITKEAELVEEIKAPIAEGTPLGSMKISANGELLAEIPIIAGNSVNRLSFWSIFGRLIKILLTGAVNF